MRRVRLIQLLLVVAAGLCLWLLLRTGRDPEPQAAPAVGEPVLADPPVRAASADRTPVAPPPRKSVRPHGVGAGPATAGPGRRRASTAAGLNGVVKEHRSGGVSGMLLELVDAAGATLLSTTSDAKGRFAFERLAPDAVALMTRMAPAGLPRIRHATLPVRTNEHVIVWVPPVGWIRGTVVDADGSPAAGAVVSTDRPYMPMGLLPWQVVEGPEPKATFQAKADAQGQFELRFALAGKHRLRAQRDGLVGSAKVDSNERGVVIRLGTHLGDAVALSGQVSNRVTGEPVAGARIWVNRVNRTGGGRSATGVASATSDELGRYQVRGLDDGNYELGTMPDGFAQCVVDARPFEAGQHVVDLTPMPARKLRVQVLLPDGRPAAKAKVRVRDRRDDPVEVPGRFRLMGDGVRANAKGVANLHGVPATQVTLLAVMGDFVPAGRLAVDLGQDPRKELTIRMPIKPVRFARKHFFLLQEADGEPATIDGTAVASCFDGEALLSRVEGRWRGGKFVLGNERQYDFSKPTIAIGASARACRIVIEAPGYLPAELTLEPNAKSPTTVRLRR